MTDHLRPMPILDLPAVPFVLTTLTKREHYAGLALQGLLADPKARAQDKRMGEGCIPATARLAVEHADALIEALNR